MQENKKRSECTWDEWVINCERVDCQPFMAWKGRKVVHTARYNPAYPTDFLIWLRNQEATARAKKATASCCKLLSGKTEFKKYPRRFS